MLEFKGRQWMGGFVDYCYNKDGYGVWRQSSTCFTNGMTYGVRNMKGGLAVYDLTLWKNNLPLSYGASYFCPFSKEQILYQLEDIKKTVEMNYILEELDDRYHIMILIDATKYVNYRLHFYVMTRVRYLWEFPQSALFWDAMRLKERVPEFKEVELDDIYNVVVSSIPLRRDLPVDKNSGPWVGYRGGGWYDMYHSIPPISDKVIEINFNKLPLNERINRIKLSSLNSLNSISTVPAIKLPGNIERLDSLVYWESDLGFATRIPYYMNNLNRASGQPLKSPSTSKGMEEDLDSLMKTSEELENKPVSEFVSTIQREDWAIKKLSRIKRLELLLKQDGMTEIVLERRKVFDELHPRDKYGRFIKRQKK